MQKTLGSQKYLSKDIQIKQQQLIQSPRKPFISLSLPKINEMDNQSQSDILSRQIFLPNIYKVKWSLSPTCLEQNHENKQVIYICLDPKCKQNSRLACEICFYQNHSQHNSEFIAIDQVKSAEIGKLRYWPFDKKFKTIHEFINKHENYVNNLIQDINATFNQMTKNIMDEINKLRLIFLNDVDKFYVQHPTKRIFLQQLKKQMELSFELKKIRRTTSKLFSKQIKHQLFLSQMQKILNDDKMLKKRQKLYEYFMTAERGTDMTFDKKQFIKKQNWIVQQILQQKTTIKQQKVKIQFNDLPVQQLIPQSLQLIQSMAHQYYPITFTKQKNQDGIYSGFIHQKQKVVFGMKIYKNGVKYMGQWKANVRSGWGLLINQKIGSKYRGQWKDDKRTGYGIQQTLNSTYQGQFYADKKQGFGVLLQNGKRLQINWKNDKKHGKGKLIEGNGIQTEVYFLNGVQAPLTNLKTTGVDLKQLSKKYSSKDSNSKKRQSVKD